MRRLLVLAAALTIMWGLRGLPSATGGAGPDPLTLAAVGFVVLAAFTVGELGARLGLPKVTGYIVAGLALGPQAADILSTSVVQEMRVFNTLALGLIATTAGLELDLKSIRRVWKALTAMVVLKIPLLIVLVGGAFYAIESSLPSLGLPPEAIAPVALIVAVLGIGTSPAIALAVVNEGGSKGRLTDLLLAMAVVKDLVVVVSLAIALALAKAMLDPTAHLDAHVLVHVAEELGSSIAVGAVLGVLLIAYTRYVHKQMLLFILLTILVVAEISATLHLELLLVFIVAGFLVRNFSDLEHDLLHPLERIALPVFVVFFTTAGAGVDLIGTLGLLPLALSLVVARTLAFYLAGRMGGAIAGEGAAVVDNAWLTWLPQAGVTLGLVLLAAKALPDFAEPLTAIGMALVAIHLLVGPVTLGLGLRRAGEMGQAKAGADPHAHAEGSHDSPVEGEAASEEAHPSEPTEEVPATAEVPVAAARRPMSEVLTGVADPEAASTVRGLVADLQARIDAFVDHEARPAADAVRVHLAARVPDAGGDFFGGLRESALAPVELTHEAWLDQVNALYDDLARIVQALPHELTLAPQDPPPTHEARDPEGNLVALGRRARWLAEGRSWRRPPVGMLAREALEGRLAAAVLELSATWHRAQAAMCEAAAPGLLGAESPDLARTDIGNVEAEWVHSVRTALEDALLEGTTVLMDALVECASPLGRPRTPRYSEVESAVERARAEWVTDEPAWQDAVEAAGEHLRLVSIVAVLLNRTAELHQSWGQDALDAFEADLERSTGAVIERLTALKGTVAASTTPDLPAWEAQMKKVFPVRARLDLRLAAQTFRQRVQPARLSEELEAVLDNLPKRLRVVGLPVSTVGDVKDVDTHPLDVAATLRTLLLDARVPELCRALEHLTPQLVSCHSLVAECVEVASYGLSTAARDPDSAKASALEALERSIRRLELYRTELVEAIRVSRELLESEQQETEGDLRALLTPRSSVARITSGLSATRRIVGSRLSALLGRITAGGQWVSSWVTTRLEDPALLDRAVRSGARSMDGEQMRRRVRQLVDASAGGSVLGLYSDRPVDDRRQFVAHRSALDRVRAQLGKPDPVTPLLALVTGARGSGRTSLVNVVQLSARRTRVVRPEDVYHERTLGLLQAIARELRCDNDSAAIRAALATRRTLVLVDNLERFLVPDADVGASVAEVLALAAETASDGTQWVFTAERSVVQRLNELTPVTALFNQHIDLATSDWQELRDVMTARARLGGFDIELAAQSNRVDRLLRSPEESWFSKLVETTDGNLAAAMAAWRVAVAQGSERHLEVAPFESRELPFFTQLPELARGVLGLLYGWGPMSPEELARSLDVSVADLVRHLQVLRAAQLIAVHGTRGEHFTVPTPLLASVGGELRRRRTPVGGEA